MRLYKHILALLLALIPAGVYLLWPAKPLWVAPRQEVISFAGKDIEHHAVCSLVRKDGGESWYLESRDYRTGQVLRELKLLVPEHKGDRHFIRMSNDQIINHHILVFCNSWREKKPTGGMKVNEQCWLLDPATGGLIKKEPYFVQSLGTGVTQRGDHLALANGNGIRLITGKNASERCIPIEGSFNHTLSPDGQTLAFTADNQLYFLDWKSGQYVKTAWAGNPIYSLGYLSNGTLLIAEHRGSVSIKRWRWDGKAVTACSQARVIDADWPVRYREESANRLHLRNGVGESWPLRFQTLFAWLDKQGLPMNRWYPKVFQEQWLVLNQENQTVEEYQQPTVANKIAIEGGYGVVYTGMTHSGASIIEGWSMVPRWPNALAIAIVFYMLTYVMARCAGIRIENVPDR